MGACRGLLISHDRDRHARLAGTACGLDRGPYALSREAWSAWTLWIKVPRIVRRWSWPQRP